MPSDDSNLKQRWDDLQRERADPKSTTDTIIRERLRIEEEAIEMAFEDIVRRRQAGELTDDTRITQIIEIVSNSARFLEIQVSFEKWERKPLDQAKFSWMWSLSAAPKDMAAADRFVKFFERLHDEITQLPSVERHESYVNEWIVDTMIWSGPPRLLRRLQKLWTYLT